MTMLKLVCNALKDGKTDLAEREFQELPYRLKKEIYLVIAKKKSSIDVEIGSKCFHKLDGYDVEVKTKIECLDIFEMQLEEIYKKESEQQDFIMSILKQDFQETLEQKEEKVYQFESLVKNSEEKEFALHETLNDIQQCVFRVLEIMRAKIQMQHQKIEKNETAIQSLQEGANGLTYKNQTLEKELRNYYKGVISTEEKGVQTSVEEEFVSLPLEWSLMGKFTQYVHEKCSNYTLKDVEEFIKEGKRLIEEVQKGRAALIPYNERKSKIVPLTWYMLYFAVCKNQGFDEGTIVFQDPGHAISKFFLACGRPAVHPRKSSHFQDRLLPTFFENEKLTTSYGIDIPQDYKNGLPGTKRTVNFCPLKTNDGLNWSFFKPEKWGLDDLYQFTRHAWDYIATRPAHLFGDPNGPEDRKEHIPPSLKTTFEEIYYKATSQSVLPQEVKTFGIAGMKTVFEGLLKSNQLSLETQGKITVFLNELCKTYDYLDTRNGNEALLGISFIGGLEPSVRIHESLGDEAFIKQLTKDAQMTVKHASHPEELLAGLCSLKNKMLIHTIKNQVDEVVSDFLINDTASLLNKEAIFRQVDKDLKRNDNVEFKVDGSTFENAEKLYTYLLTVEPFSSLDSVGEKEQASLRFMALLQQGSRAALFSQLQEWFEQPLQGLHIKQVSPRPKEIVVHICVQTKKDPIIEIKQLFELLGCNDENSFYHKEPYARIEGMMKIDFNQQLTSMKAATSITS